MNSKKKSEYLQKLRNVDLIKLYFQFIHLTTQFMLIEMLSKFIST